MPMRVLVMVLLLMLVCEAAPTRKSQAFLLM
jgi:hypothetical protein